MTISRVAGVRLAGVASAVPECLHEVSEFATTFGEEEVRKISESTGVVKRYISPEAICTSDLCYFAANKLLESCGWSRESVDLLVFVSQTADYLLPATACTLQSRLALSKSCAAFDVTLGCSGYIYGLWIASGMIASGSARRALLLVGDTSNKAISPRDRSTCLLFGDAGTATAIEKCDGGSGMTFVLGTDGSGKDHLIIPAGGFRKPSTDLTKKYVEREGGNIRSEEDLFMNGAEIFSFTLREVPPLIKSVLAESGWTMEQVDSFVFHQANKFMLEFLGKKMKLPREKLPIVLEKYGNTSSATVPLAMTEALASRLRGETLRLVLAGFGVGFSWGAVALECGPMVMPDLILVPEDGILATSA
jgi:3-oxoacyl-[acyl-carrier-protein] synthase-3